MKPSALIISRTYFRLTFADLDLTMPGVEPVVYLGEVSDENGTHGFVFQDTVSYVRFGSGLEGEEQHEEIALTFVPETELGAMYDVEELAAEVGEAARRAVSLNFPALEALRTG
jgi:hypothetical protein